MKRILPMLGWFCVAICFAWNPDASHAADQRPNIVLIMADDMGYSDLGCFGGEIETPHLNALAKKGLRFSQFYNTGRCWPTRASLLTGLYPHQARKAMTFGPKAPPAYSGLVPNFCRMIPELLAEKGYRSYHIGKWHLNKPGREPNETWPLGRGFGRSYFSVTQNNYFSPRLLYDEDQKIERPGGDFYATRNFSTRAVEYLKQHARRYIDQPFFMYLAYTAPHFPLHALAEDVARFRGKYKDGWDRSRQARYRRLKEMGILNCELSPRDPDAKAWNSLSEKEQDEWDARMATYAAMIYRIDVGIGRVVEQLKSMSALDNTLILFLSDNGASAEYLVRGDGHKPGSAPGSAVSYRCLEVGWSNAANTPFRFHKIWVHEGGISTPLIAHWPQGIPSQGKITHDVGHVIDIMPTILDITGTIYPKTFHDEKTFPLPGRSLSPAFQGNRLEQHPFLFWEHVGNKAIRKGDWKLVAEHQGDWELYNLKVDRSELKNLAKTHPEKVRQLKQQWQQYADKIGVVDWDSLPQSRRKPSTNYRRK